jgi:GDP-L-fucose synthase
MPANLYGYFDNFDLKTSHVLPAMIRKFHEAKVNDNADVVLWSIGTP